MASIGRSGGLGIWRIHPAPASTKIKVRARAVRIRHAARSRTRSDCRQVAVPRHDVRCRRAPTTIPASCVQSEAKDAADWFGKAGNSCRRLFGFPAAMRCNAASISAKYLGEVRLFMEAACSDRPDSPASPLPSIYQVCRLLRRLQCADQKAARGTHQTNRPPSRLHPAAIFELRFRFQQSCSWEKFNSAMAALQRAFQRVMKAAAEHDGERRAQR